MPLRNNDPTARQMEAFHLRCTGMPYTAIAKELGILPCTAGALAHTAAQRILRKRSPPSPYRTLAMKHFPMIAARYDRKAY
jgi:hypothetical protein